MKIIIGKTHTGKTTKLIENFFSAEECSLLIAKNIPEIEKEIYNKKINNPHRKHIFDLVSSNHILYVVRKYKNDHSIKRVFIDDVMSYFKIDPEIETSSQNYAEFFKQAIQLLLDGEENLRVEFEVVLQSNDLSEEGTLREIEIKEVSDLDEI